MHALNTRRMCALVLLMICLFSGFGHARAEETALNVLLIGVDSAAEGQRGRSDVMMLACIRPESGSVHLVSFLRDLYVSIPGVGKTRLNAAYHYGGEALLKQTLEENFGIKIDGNLEVDFSGFTKIIDTLGGVSIELRQDEAEAINLSTSRTLTEGTQLLTGTEALAYARIRKLDSDGDFSRTARQRKLLEILLSTVMQDMDVMKLYSLMESVIPYVATNMNATAIFNLATSVLQSGIIQKAQSGETLMEQFRLPMDKAYSYKTIDGASVVYMSTSKFKQNKEALHEFIYGSYYPAE